MYFTRWLIVSFLLIQAHKWLIYCKSKHWVCLHALLLKNPEQLFSLLFMWQIWGGPGFTYSSKPIQLTQATSPSSHLNFRMLFLCGNNIFASTLAFPDVFENWQNFFFFVLISVGKQQNCASQIIPFYTAWPLVRVALEQVWLCIAVI